MRPKISDFGLARMFKEEQSEANTKRVVGTLGYISSKYVVNGKYSVKSDIFNFKAWRLYQEDKSLDLLDKCLHSSYSAGEVLRSLHVSLLCVQQRVEDRPNTPTMVAMLGVKVHFLLPKNQFSLFKKLSEINSSSTLPLLPSSSVNRLPLTDVDGSFLLSIIKYTISLSSFTFCHVASSSLSCFCALRSWFLRFLLSGVVAGTLYWASMLRTSARKRHVVVGWPSSTAVGGSLDDGVLVSSSYVV
ncbi:hypothetical protein QVD17_31413 [Tagetes erecta]|uniref:Protein kinase domain-containing protein n=1 Tax=Tagetes erecta TaxID=13708 RepID=A0AAD8K3C4_TARER|nr:hypothetical protein QVD17_31413 [Tagetes erecta]